MKKKHIPFSNGSEALSWLDANCDSCKRSGCQHQYKVHLSFATGYLVPATVDFIGTSKRNQQGDEIFVRLNSPCQHFSERRISTKKRKKKTDKSQSKLF